MLTHDSDCLNVFEIPRSTSIPTLLQTTFYIVNTNSQNWFLIGTKLREICVMHCLHSLICFFNTSRVCCSGHVQILKYLFCRSLKHVSCFCLNATKYRRRDDLSTIFIFRIKLNSFQFLVCTASENRSENLRGP